MLSCWITGFGQLTTPSSWLLCAPRSKRPLTLVLRSCWSRLSRTKQTEMTTIRLTRLHLKTGQKRHSDAAGENQNTTNSKDSKCRNALMAGYLFRRHHGRLPIPQEHHVEPDFGFVPVLSDGDCQSPRVAPAYDLLPKNSSACEARRRSRRVPPCSPLFQLTKT